MALVMLPCELPWWSVVIRKITSIENTNDVEKIIEVMQKIHDLCNISLDPDEDQMDSTVFDGLKNFLENDMNETERDKFLNSTLKCICQFAKNLKNFKPPRGMNFSLQQNIDSVDYDVKFVASLLANSFFSTYPKRTGKTHPTLKDFNFTHFFKDLSLNSQKAKFKSFLWYFEWLDTQNVEEIDRKIRISRKVMSGKQWLTIEDWLECKLPLCPMDIKHDLRIECSSESHAQVIFSQPNIGSTVLLGGCNQESTQLATHPELLIILLFVERLEDNEILMAENVIQVSRIIDPKSKAIVEKYNVPKVKSTLICMDAESYIDYSPNQFEEDNCLRELNKCLLAFRQNTCTLMSSKMLKILSNHSYTSKDFRGRLSPIGENHNVSERSSLDCSTKIIIEPTSPTTSTPTFNSQMDEAAVDKRRSWLNLPENKLKSSTENDLQSAEEKRRGRFIVLGSSGEHLPVNRGSLSPSVTDNRSSLFFNDDTSDDEDVFYSARNSLNEDDATSENSHDENFDHQRYSIELETPENRLRFAQKLKEALKLENGYTESTEDCSIDEDEFDGSYAVDINVEGSKIHDQEIKIRRGTSTGFILDDESSFDDFQLLDSSKNQQSRLKRNKTGDSSSYSFETEESDLDEMYDNLEKWLNDPLDSRDRKLDSRDKTILQFANSLLKRALSEGFLSEKIESPSSASFSDYKNLTSQQKRKMIRNFKSLSLEVAKYKNQINSQTKMHESPEEFRKFIELKVSEGEKNSLHNNRKWSITSTILEENINCDVTLKLNQRKYNINNNLRSIATGNWGSGKQGADPQFKVLIQWLAASVANVPILIYYTCSKDSLSKLDTLVRVLHDRKWTVGELLQQTLFYAKNILNNSTNHNTKNFCLFEKLIGLDKYDQ